jgi:hypothetical protein
MERSMIAVMVIGTEPVCPRCDLVARLVQEVARESNVQVDLRHFAFDSEDARALGRRLGRNVGTAKHVAKAAGIPIDWDAVHRLIDRRREALGPDARPADTWTPELDRMLEPCQQVAESVGYLMTPVLVVNGVVTHHGSVPTREEIRSWILE